ncbi:MAG: hypothetical protein DMG16_12250 [Acidobacteria bacterium]|nr:MAG: hypothetical protein DMG16_12250 [Acidobacteriota bacterium]
MRIRFLIVRTLLLALMPAMVLAQDPQPLPQQNPISTLRIVRLSEPLQFDDFLDGAEGADHTRAAAVTGFRQRDPGDGVAVSAPTTAYLSYDDENLYVVFVCKDDPTKVRATLANREDVGNDDGVAVYLDTFHDRKRAYIFWANPLGVQLDGIMTEGQDDDYSFDTVWQSEGQLTPEGYVVRLTIPFRSLRFGSGAAQSWGIALGRFIRRYNEESYWPYLTKRVSGLVPQFATLEGLQDIAPGRNVRFNPYTAFTGARFLDASVPAFRRANDARIGLDAKAVLGGALTLDGTVNPDFSQVESDQPQVTINERFEVFFPEKRPFFIENAGYFQTPVNLFFSRRIADPGRGLRLTGKAGRWAVGAIGTDDRAAGAVPGDARAGIGVVRVQRDFGGESTVGMLASDRSLHGGSNRVVSADTRLKLTKTWIFSGQAMATRTQDTSATRSSGTGWYANLLHDGRNLDYSATYLDLSPSFETQLGFVKRVGIRQFGQQLQIIRRPKGPVVRFGPTFTTSLDWDPHGRLLDRSLEASFEVKLRRETKLVVGREQAFELFGGLPFDTHRTRATFQSEWLKWLAGSAKIGLGTAVNHKPAKGLSPYLADAQDGAVGLTLRPIRQLRLDHTFLYERLKTRPGAALAGDSPKRILANRILREKLNYQFTRLLSFRAIVDYSTVDRDSTLSRVEPEHRWGVDLLFTYLVHPGTALYVGYSDRYENFRLLPGNPPALERSSSPGMSMGRQVFVKLNYLWLF